MFIQNTWVFCGKANSDSIDLEWGPRFCFSKTPSGLEIEFGAAMSLAVCHLALCHCGRLSSWLLAQPAMHDPASRPLLLCSVSATGHALPLC